MTANKPYRKDYSAQQRAYFERAEWVTQRSWYAPLQCHSGAQCWVKFGPPAYSRTGSSGVCIGCGGRPTFTPNPTVIGLK